MVELSQGLGPVPSLWLPRADQQAWGDRASVQIGDVCTSGVPYGHTALARRRMSGCSQFCLDCQTSGWAGCVSLGGRLGEVCHRLLDCSFWVQSECVMSGIAGEFVLG